MALHLVEDVDLVIDADAGSLSQSLDSVGDLTAETLAFKLGGHLGIEHDSSRSLRLTGPLFVSGDGLVEGLDDLEHTLRDFVTVDGNLSIADVLLDLVISQLGECSLELLVELFLEDLSHCPVVWLDRVLDVGVLVCVREKFNAVKLVLDVVLELDVASEDLLVSVDKSHLGQRVLHADHLLCSDKSADFNGALHASHGCLDFLVDQIIGVARHISEVDGVLVQRVVLGETIPKVLVQVLRHEWRDWGHELGRAEKHVEQDSEGDVLVLNC